MKPTNYIGPDPKKGGARPGARQAGHIIGARRRVKICLSFDPDILEQARSMAIENQISISALFEFLFKMELERNGVAPQTSTVIPPLPMVANGKLVVKR